MTQKTIVWSLVGTSTFDVSIRCLTSLLKYSSDALHLYILSDGTLTDAQIAKLECSNITVVKPDPDLNRYIDEKVNVYPHLKKVYQDGIPTMKKLVDIPILATEIFTQSNSFNYIDSDIIFVRPFQNLFSDNQEQFTFLSSADISISFFDLLLINQNVFAFLNSGVLQSTKPKLDSADFVLQKLLETPEKTKTFTNPWVWEQTVYSYLFANQPQFQIRRADIYTPKYKEDLLATVQAQTQKEKLPIAYHLIRGYKEHAEALTRTCLSRTVRSIQRETVTANSASYSATLKMLSGFQNRLLRLTR